MNKLVDDVCRCYRCDLVARTEQSKNVRAQVDAMITVIWTSIFAIAAGTAIIFYWIS